MHSKLLFLILVLLLIPIAQAQNNDISLTLNKQSSSVCPSNTDLLTVQVGNTDTEERQFTVNVAGSASPYTTIIPTGFILKPGEKRLVYVYITPKSKTLSGNYNLDITVSNDNSVAKTLSYSLNVLDCHNIEIIPDIEKSVCPCSLERFEFTVNNLGNFKETLQLQVSGPAADFIILSESVISVDTASSKQVFVYVENICQTGRFEFTLTAFNNDVASASSAVNIVPCFDFSLATEKDLVNMCDRSVTELPITIRNEGIRTNQYSLSVSGPDFANLDRNTMELAPDQTDVVNLILSPDYGIQGSFDITFNAISAVGDIEALKLIRADVNLCNSVFVDIEKSDDKICNSLSNTYAVVIKNNGIVKNDFNLLLNGPTWASIDTSFLSLEPDEQDSLLLTINPSIDVSPAEYQIEIIAQSIDEGFRNSDTITIETISKEQCFQPKIIVEDKDVKLDFDSTLTLPIIIENTGAEEATYTIGLSGTATNFVQLNPSVIDLASGQSEIVYLYIAPNADIKEGNYVLTVTSNIEETQILDSEEIKIEIIKPEEITTTIIEEREEENVTVAITGETVKEVGNFLFTYRFFIISGIILLIIIILLAKLGFFKKAEEVFEEDFEEELKEPEKPVEKLKTVKKKEPKKEEPVIEPEFSTTWLLWIIGLIVILALGYLAYTVNLLGYLLAYKFFIIIGIIVLIVIILIVKYKKAIVEFFEEEAEEEPKKVEKKVKVEKPKKEPKSEKPFDYSKLTNWVLIAIVVLIVAFLIYLGFTLDLEAYLSVYKFYIIGGAVLLIIILLIISLRKKIMDFFIEEVEEKKETPKKPVKKK